MHEHYARDGLVCMSVTVDELSRKEAALAFLKKQKATFANYLLNEEASVWAEKWSIAAPPAVFVFDRDGKRAAKFDTSDSEKSFTYDDVEKVVKQLLPAKAR
jgi:hypothetical protein